MAVTKDPIGTIAQVANETQLFSEKGAGSTTEATSNPDIEATPKDAALEKRIMRKIDLWLVGFYSLVYVFRVIDSANYSNAAIINLEAGTGIKKQLGFTPSQWAWTLSIFSYSYLIFEPTNTPPYVSAFLLLNALGFMLQRKWIRPWVTAVGIESTIIVCYIILLLVDNPVVRYLCLIVSVACAGCAYPVIWPERIRALEGTVASGIGIGLTNACAQFGGIIGNELQHSKENRFGNASLDEN
ncbi:hypothetical protein K4K61_006170 [Colletotrichum sp. SAR11_59]|nr:hypothetical protein K4K61_006170 [Colletotrichum sp. SAR11_59]